MRRALLRAVLPAALLAGLAAGCGGSGNAEAVLAETAERLGDIRSGALELSLLVEPRGGGPFGFRLEGPFALRRRGLPLMRIDYTRVVDGREATVRLVSDGREAYAKAEGRRVELTPAQQAELAEAAAALSPGGSRLPLGDWFREAELSDGGSIAGAATDRVTGTLDVVAVANGLGGLAGLDRLAGQEAEQLREAVEEARFELWTGREDRLLRRLELVVALEMEVPAELRRALGPAAGATVRFLLAVARPNQPVVIESEEG